jgi:uncharacterized protein (TIGR03545 family)
MADRIPKRFRKELSQRAFEKKVLGRVHLPKERAFLDSLFETTADGTRRLPESVSEEDGKHLTRLAKDIKANRGSIRRMRLIALGILVVALVAFNVLFLDALLERAAERGLESVFRARSDIDALDLSPFAGTLTMERVTVGDRRRPMKNLFELERLTASINLIELLKGNVVIRDASVETVSTGTDRETSALLPRARRTDEAGARADGEEGPSVADRARQAAAGTFDEVSRLADPAALVEQELANLESPALVEDLREQYTGFTQRWADRIGTLEEETEDTVTLAARVREINPEALDTPQEIADAIALVGQASNRVDSLLAATRDAAGATREEYGALQSNVSRVESSLARDFEYIASRLSLDAVDVSSFVSGLAREFLVRFLGQIYGTAQRALEITDRLRREGETTDAAGIARAPGRVVTFPTVTYPRFLLERAALGVEPGGMDLRLDGELTDLSSEPALLGRPTALSLSGATSSVSLAADSELSYDENRADRLLTTVSGTGFSFRPPEIPQLGELSSTYEFETTLELARGGGATSRTFVELAGLDLQRADGGNLVVSSLQDVVAGLDTVDVDAAFRIAEGSFTLEELSTSADEALRRGVAESLERRRDELVARARGELEGRVEAALAELEPLRERAATLRSEAERLRSVLENRDALIAEKRAELEQRSRALADEQRRRVEDEARRRIEDATEDLDIDGFDF